MPPAATRKHRPPKGTRDFFPGEMAVRRHIESVWRRVAVAYGFDEIDGPMFEHLDIYTIKSGPGIESELFSFRRAGGDDDYALRPEFTPTLARMYGANARSLPKPTKWFAMVNMFRAERPQRGRLREHIQWNVDVVGDDSARAEAELIAVAVHALGELGLAPEQMRIKISHRGALERALASFGVPEDRMLPAFSLVDAMGKLDDEEFKRRALEVGIAPDRWEDFAGHLAIDEPMAGNAPDVPELQTVHAALAEVDLLPWCDHKTSLARGLAYYTGTVFELHVATGRERAVAGGGRYDHLIELFGGPPTPAVGFAMGDVVIALVLEELGLLRPGPEYLPRPDLFAINARTDDDGPLRTLVADLRRGGFHVRHSYRATTNVGKLLREASSAGARFAAIIGEEFDTGQIVLRDLDRGEQEETPIADVAATLRARLAETDCENRGAP